MRVVVAYIIALSLLVSCGNNDRVSLQDNKSKALKESLEKANRALITDEEEDINNYIRRHKLKVQETGTGLRYQIIEQGDGVKVKEGDVVTLEYSLYSITGDKIYSSEDLGPKVFAVGRSEAEKGLHEAVLNMRCGDRAKVILPAHLGYGLMGDMNKIPPRSILIYDIRITKIQ